ncbi:cytochrome P450 [Streptomyces sp. AV19]|uniref:cytochrome P450 n=1 Tax=Streptomyces sp. AV19 TaxID=2793068 RepID=UPI0018FE119B|nr:cytochrome P450 [Streptomyces sp. AV19]MBH1935804.1 cytochrome P450 [Streptomyces sp. AV19]MDG4536106.1 cytochrome P450 [Streptomyces sp. AV19]
MPDRTDHHEGTHCPALSSAAVSAAFLAPSSAGLHTLLRELRDGAPVFFSEELNVWIVTRYEDVLRILKDAELFPASTRSVILGAYPPDVSELLAATATFTAPNMGFDGRPTHDRLRKPVTPCLSAQGVARLEPRIRDMADHCAARLPGAPPADLVADYARPMAVALVMALAGFPDDDHDRVLRYHRAVSEFFFGSPPPDRQLAYARDVQEWEAYLAALIRERGHRPGDDLISHLAAQGAYTERELISLISFDIVTAGIGPTGYALTVLCRELLEDPRRRDALLAEPALFDGYFAESLRRSGPALGVFRTAAAETELGGVRIPAGAALWAMIASADRDERRFERPDDHDPARPRLGASLHFSHGLHYCLGATLARTAVRTAAMTLLRHRPGLRLVPDQPRVYEPGINVIAPARLLVEW